MRLINEEVVLTSTPTVYTTSGFGEDSTQIIAKLYQPKTWKERCRKAIEINIYKAADFHGNTVEFNI